MTQPQTHNAPAATGVERPTASAECRVIELQTDDEGNLQVPEWIQLMPPGPELMGRDGREWRMSEPDAVARLSELPLVIDYEHGSAIRAPMGEESPAAGWIEELAVEQGDGERAPGIWGRVAWTARGAGRVAEKEYRFISPEFLFDRETGEVVRLAAAGLVNRPNFRMQALNSEGQNQEESVMTDEERKALCKHLGVADDACAEAMQKAAAALQETASNAQQKVREHEQAQGQMVPKSDLDAALNRAQAAEAAIAERDKKAFEDRKQSVLNAAQKAGKFPPASRQFYEDTCRNSEDLDRLEKEMESRASLVKTEDTEAEAKAAEERDPSKTITEEERAIAHRLGLTDDEFIASKKEEK